MAELKDRLRADLNDAMRARDQVRMRTLRMALTSITNEEVAGASALDLSDEEIVKILTREARKRREAAEAFGAACALAACSDRLSSLDRQPDSALSICRSSFWRSAARGRSSRWGLRPDSARLPGVDGVPGGCPSLPPYASDLASCAIGFVLDVMARRAAGDFRATGGAGDAPRSGAIAPVAAPRPN